MNPEGKKAAPAQVFASKVEDGQVRFLIHVNVQVTCSYTHIHVCRCIMYAYISMLYINIYIYMNILYVLVKLVLRCSRQRSRIVGGVSQYLYVRVSRVGVYAYLYLYYINIHISICKYSSRPAVHVEGCGW